MVIGYFHYIIQAWDCCFLFVEKAFGDATRTGKDLKQFPRFFIYKRLSREIDKPQMILYHEEFFTYGCFGICKYYKQHSTNE